jgi:hypothetical protein
MAYLIFQPKTPKQGRRKFDVHLGTLMDLWNLHVAVIITFFVNYRFLYMLHRLFYRV